MLDYLLKKYSGYEVPPRTSYGNESDMKYSGRRNVEISQIQRTK